MGARPSQWHCGLPCGGPSAGAQAWSPVHCAVSTERHPGVTAGWVMWEILHCGPTRCTVRGQPRSSSAWAARPSLGAPGSHVSLPPREILANGPSSGLSHTNPSQGAGLSRAHTARVQALCLWVSGQVSSDSHQRNMRRGGFGSR